MYNKKLLKSKKIAAITLCAALMAAMTLTSCGTVSAADTETNTIVFEATSFTGVITSIEDNTITLSISAGNNTGMQAMGDGSAPSMPGGDGSNGSAPEMPGGDGSNGNEDGSAPSMPDGNGGSGDGSAPSMPDGNGGSGDGSAPEKPDGNGGSGDGSAPEKPDGNGGSGDGSAPSMPEENGENGDAALKEFNADSTEAEDGQEESEGITVILTLNDTSVLTDENGEALEISDLEEGNYLKVSLDTDGNIESVVLTENTGMDGSMGGNGNGSAPGGNQGGGMGGQSSGVDSYTAVTEFQEDTTEDGQTYTSTGADENAILVDSGASVTISNATITRDSDDSTGGDNSSFYGVGAAVLATDGAVYVKDSTIETDAAGGAGVFAYGEGTAYVSRTSITTQQGTSGGLHVAGGGTLYAWDCSAETNGASAAAVRSDRGGGTMVIDGGSYTSNGTGSPAIYCTADIAINDADLTANGSEAVCIEGLNSIHLYNSNLTGNMPENEQNDCTWNVIVYQSMSGDSEVGNGTFSMIGGTLTAKNGGMFYTTNTDSTFYLSGVDITYADENDFFLKCTGNSNARGWGSTGSNGANCSFTAEDQSMEGDIVYDSISTLNFYMVGTSTLTGAVYDDETNAGNGGDGTCTLYIDADAVWTVTEDSILTNLHNAGTIVDADGKTVSIIGTDGTVYVQGDSDLTVTVENYSADADLSGASQSTEFADYEVENPLS